MSQPAAVACPARVARLPERPRILVAEDDAALRGLLCEALANAGAVTEECETGLQLLRAVGWRRAVEDLPDLIVTDFFLSGVSCVLGLTELRRRSWLPVIAITAFGDDDTRDQALAAGASVLLDKPIDMETLCAWVQALGVGVEPGRREDP